MFRAWPAGIVNVMRCAPPVETPIWPAPEFVTFGKSPTMIDDAIRNAESDHQIYSLLTAYIETLQFGIGCPEQPTNPAIIGLDDVRTRFRQLITEFDNASTHAEDKRPLMKQALYIYGAALCRLQSLDEKKNRSIGKDVPEHGMSHVYRALPDGVGTSSIP
jgi:hypothetical protein